MMKPEKVSLILTTFNCGKQLPITLESIKRQDYCNLEVIIKDGASTDDTVEIIKSYQEEGFLNIYYESSRDSGIYDAMNKGLQMSTGDIIAFFNDEFADEQAVGKLVTAMNGDVGRFAGAHSDLIYREKSRVVRYWKMGNGGDIRNGWMPAHPTLFLRRHIYEEYGMYRTDLKCSSDYEFMIRVLKHRENRLAYVPEILVSMFYGGTSNQGLKNYVVSLKEGHIALVSNNVKPAWLIDVKRTWKVLQQFYKAKRLNQINGIIYSK